MSLEYLDNTIDIHTGGEDNKFPHHENEIAQSEGATGEKFVRLWMHNRHLRVGGAKLAKREGEQITLDTINEKGYSPLAFRLLVLGSHYRSPIDFTWEALAGASENLETLRQLVRRLREKSRPSKGEGDDDVLQRFGKALADDLNTPEALAVLLGYVRSANKELDNKDIEKDDIGRIWATLIALDKVMGVFTYLIKELEAEDIPDEIKQMVKKREMARHEGNFEQADELREQISHAGYIVEDTDSEPRIIRR